MGTRSELEQVHIVAYGLSKLVEEAISILQGILAFGDNYPMRASSNAKEDWYSLAYSALLKNLVLEAASLLDHAKYRKESNCNFKELKYVLENCDETKQKYQTVIADIDELLAKHENVLPDDLRHKVIAHKDLDKLFAGEEYTVNLIEISRFLMEGYKVVSDVMELAVGAPLQFPNLDAIKQSYEESLTLP